MEEKVMRDKNDKDKPKIKSKPPEWILEFLENREAIVEAAEEEGGGINLKRKNGLINALTIKYMKGNITISKAVDELAGSSGEESSSEKPGTNLKPT